MAAGSIGWGASIGGPVAVDLKALLPRRGMALLRSWVPCLSVGDWTGLVGHRECSVGASRRARDDEWRYFPSQLAADPLCLPPSIAASLPSLAA